MWLFDELSDLSEDEIIDIETYFESMELSDEEKEDKKDFARKMDEVILFIFSLFLTMKDYSYIDKNFIIKQLETRCSEVVSQFTNIDGYIEDYIERFSKDAVDTTLKNGADDYWTSEERSTLISVNEANSILGYRQLQEAIEKGYTKKTWITEGDSLMMYAHDFNAEAKEAVNCRCSTVYS